MSDTTSEVITLLDRVLSLQGRGLEFTRQTRLLGAVPELDSMAVATLLTSIEERYGVSIDDDEVDGAAFATVGSLVDFVEHKVRG